MASGNMLQDSEVARTLQLGGTTIRFIEPKKLPDVQRQSQHNEILKAVARCLLDKQETTGS